MASSVALPYGLQSSGWPWPTASSVTGGRKMTELVAERERIALLVEQMGMWGYGTLAIAAAIRSGTKASELDDISSPADRRKLANRPWGVP